MPRISQGTVIWAQLPAPIGDRPVVILTRDAAIGQLNALTVAPITRMIRNLPTEVVLHPVDGLPSISAVSLDNIMTVPRSRFGEVITVLTRARVLQIFQAIRVALDMD